MVTEALLVVDVQRDVMAANIRSEETVANIKTLVDKAHMAGVPVVWVRHSADDLVQGSDGWQIVDELTPLPIDTHVEKTYPDSFAETDLADRLAELGATDIVLCGAQTDACVRTTFYGALFRGYGTTLVTDAHTTQDLRPYGAQYGPEDSINVLNMQAGYTRMPTVRASVTTTQDWTP